jgi:hypothetical protein
MLPLNCCLVVDLTTRLRICECILTTMQVGDQPLQVTPATTAMDSRRLSKYTKIFLSHIP